MDCMKTNKGLWVVVILGIIIILIIAGISYHKVNNTVAVIEKTEDQENIGQVQHQETKPSSTATINPCAYVTNPYFDHVEPSGGVYFFGQSITVRWDVCGSMNALVGISIETNSSGNGASTVLSSGTTNDGNETFSIPTSLAAGNYWIKVYEVGNVSNKLFSTAPFALQAGQSPSISVVSPNGGQTLNAGSPIVVNWSSVNIPANASVVVFLEKIGSTSVESFPLSKTVGTPNDGQETFNFPQYATPGSNYKIAIITNYFGLNNAFSDESDNFFTIQ